MGAVTHDACSGPSSNGPRSGVLGLIRDLHGLWLLTQGVKPAYGGLAQASLESLGDREMETILGRVSTRTQRQADCIRTRIDHAAP